FSTDCPSSVTVTSTGAVGSSWSLLQPPSVPIMVATIPTVVSLIRRFIDPRPLVGLHKFALVAGSSGAQEFQFDVLVKEAHAAIGVRDMGPSRVLAPQALVVGKDLPGGVIERIRVERMDHIFHGHRVLMGRAQPAQPRV